MEVVAGVAVAAATATVADSNQRSSEGLMDSSLAEVEGEAVAEEAVEGGTPCEGLAPADHKSCTAGEAVNRNMEEVFVEAEGKTTR